VTLTPVVYVPLHPDELTLAGETFEVDVDFAFTDDGGMVWSSPRAVSVFVPKQVKERDAQAVGTQHRVLVYFTANSAVGDQGFNDLLTQGLRAVAQNTDWVVIVLPSPGDHGGGGVPDDKPDFVTIHDQDILDCLTAVGLSPAFATLRLISHSRGYRGMTRSLMGNDEIGDKTRLAQRDPNTATIKTSFLAISKIDRLIYLDNFFASGQRIASSLVGKGLVRTALQVYHVTDGINITDKTIVADMAKQFVTISLGLQAASPGPNQPRPLSKDQINVAAFGCLRFITAALAVKAAASPPDMSLEKIVAADPDVSALVTAHPLPVRGSLSTTRPTPAASADHVTTMRAFGMVQGDLDKLLAFLNARNLVRASPFQFSGFIAAHHFFACELVPELLA
jgi:hypothetical protein